MPLKGEFVMRLTIKLEGELDHHAASSLREQTDKKILSSRADEVVFDLSDVTFLDSSGVGLLLGRYKLFALKKMFCFGATGNVDRVLELSGVYSLIPKLKGDKAK